MKSKLISVLLFCSLIILLFSIESCSIVKKMAGADIDSLQFAKAREAKILEIRLNSIKKLKKRLENNSPIQNADMSFFISENVINNLAQCYIGSKGWLDATTSYTVDSVSLHILNGASILSIKMKANSSKFNVDVNMALDCLLDLEMVNNELITKIEPFNISPIVDARGILGASDEIISNLIKINLADIGNKFPPFKIPVDFANEFKINRTKTNIKDRINLSVISPDILLKYNIKIHEILMFDNRIYVAVNINNIDIH